MDRKIDKKDFDDVIRDKTSKRDTEMVFHSLSVLH